MFLQDVNNLLKSYTVQHCSFTQLLSYIGTSFCLTTVTTLQLTDKTLASKEQCFCKKWHVCQSQEYISCTFFICGQ